MFQNVKFQRISAVKQEGSIVAGQKDNCADVAAKSQSGDYPSVDSVHASIAKAMVNVLAIAAATKINLKEAKTMKTALAETKPVLAKNERGHVTGAQSTLSQAPQSPNVNNVQVEESEVFERQLAVSFSTPGEQAQLGEPQHFSIGDIQYDESTDTFSCRGHHVVFANPEVLAQMQEKQEGTINEAKFESAPPKKVLEETENIGRLITCVNVTNTKRSAGKSPYEPQNIDREDFPGLGDRDVIFSAPVSTPRVDFKALGFGPRFLPRPIPGPRLLSKPGRLPV